MTQVISKIVLKIDPETLMDLKQACRQRGLDDSRAPQGFFRFIFFVDQLPQLFVKASLGRQMRSSARPAASSRTSSRSGLSSGSCSPAATQKDPLFEGPLVSPVKIETCNSVSRGRDTRLGQYNVRVETPKQRQRTTSHNTFDTALSVTSQDLHEKPTFGTGKKFTFHPLPDSIDNVSQTI